MKNVATFILSLALLFSFEFVSSTYVNNINVHDEYCLQEETDRYVTAMQTAIEYVENLDDRVLVTPIYLLCEQCGKGEGIR